MTADEYMDLAQVAYADANRLASSSGEIAKADVRAFWFHLGSAEYFHAKAREAAQ